MSKSPSLLDEFVQRVKHEKIVKDVQYSCQLSLSLHMILPHTLDGFKVCVREDQV